MNREFWVARWREGRIGFHDATPNHFAITHAALLGEPPRTVFVPLCGKSRDMAHLASLGHRVVGVELAEVAATAFFAESGLSPVRSRRGSFDVFAAAGIEIYVGDVFAFARDLAAPIDAIYDRAALVALPPDDQPRYASLLASLIGAGSPMLLITFDYDQSKMQGPPFSVSEARARELYEPAFVVECLGSRDATNDRPRFREAGIDRVVETALFLTKRP